MTKKKIKRAYSSNTFGYSLLEPFVSPSENKPAKSSKYEFCSCVAGKKFVHDENIQSIDVMGLPPPIVNCLTLPGLQLIAKGLAHVAIT